MRLLPVALLLMSIIAPAVTAPAGAAPAVQATVPKALVRLELQVTRTVAPAADPVVLGTPQLTTFDGNTGSIQVSGTEFSYSLSISPALEPENRAALLWNLHLGGTSLPGVTSVNLTGATRVLLNKDETIAELTLRDPKTGVVSTYRLSGRTTSVPIDMPSTAAPSGSSTP